MCCFSKKLISEDELIRPSAVICNLSQELHYLFARGYEFVVLWREHSHQFLEDWRHLSPKVPNLLVANRFVLFCRIVFSDDSIAEQSTRFVARRDELANRRHNQFVLRHSIPGSCVV